MTAAPHPKAPTFTCPRCGAVSHNPNDARERYCGRCHLFFSPPDLADGARAAYRANPPKARRS